MKMPAFIINLFEKRSAIDDSRHWKTVDFSMKTGAGVNIGPNSCLSYSAVYGCVRNIAEDIGKLPDRSVTEVLQRIAGVTIDDIYLGNGASELIVMSMNALLNTGDEVLVPAPDYPLWTAAVSLSSGKPVHYVCDEQADWYPDLDDIRSKINANTRAIVVINPNNPTGALYPVELLQQIVELARQHLELR